MARRFLLSTLLLAAILSVPAAAQLQRVITDKAPSAVIAEPGSSRVHVLTAGIDANFNGVLDLDSGETAPRWFVIDSRTATIEDSATFDALFGSFPVRVGLDLTTRRFYMAQAGRIRAYDIGSLELVDDTVAVGPYSGVSFDPVSRTILCHVRPGFSSVGYLVGINPVTGDTLGVYQAGINPQMSVTMFDPTNSGLAVYTLNEGTFGAGNSTISYAGGQPDVFGASNGIALGAEASDLMTYRRSGVTMAVVALSGSNTVRVVDTRTHISARTIEVDVPTSLGLDTTAGGAIIVGTAGGRLIRYHEVDATPRDSFLLPGYAGAIEERGTLVAIAIPYSDAAASAVDSLVVLFDTKEGRILDTVAVGARPSTLFFDAAGDLHAIGRNIDGSVWWRKVDGVTFEPEPARSLAGITIQGDIAYDATIDSLYVVVRSPLSGRFVVAAMGTDGAVALPRLVYDDSTAAGELAGVTVGAEYLLVLERSIDPESPVGHLHVVRRSTGERVIKAQIGVDPMSAAFGSPGHGGATSIYVLNRDNGDPTLSHIAFTQNLLGSDTLGSGANHIALPELTGPAAVTMNGSHTLVLVDLMSGIVSARIPTGTSGFDGPREAVELVGSIEPEYAVTTYAGDVRLVGGAGVYRTINTGGKAEGIARVGSILYVANAFTPSYAADSTVVIIDLNASSVDAERETAMALGQNVPNPAVDRTRVRFSIGMHAHVRLEIRSVAGELVAVPVDRAMEAGDYAVELPVDRLPSGAYLYTLRAGDVIESRMMQVAR